MPRTLRRIIPTAAGLWLAAACGTGPLSPDTEISDAQFLIGQSPLAPISLDWSTDPPALDVPVRVSKIGTKIGEFDRFLLQSAVVIWDVTDHGLPVGEIYVEQPIVDPDLDAALRDGIDVDLVSSIGLHEVWAKIESKSEVHVVAMVELVRESRDGSQRVLDSMTRDGAVSPGESGSGGGKG